MPRRVRIELAGFHHGYKQIEISRYLEISSSSVSKIIKES